MSERSFFDTNILVYTDDAAAAVKQNAALELWQLHRQDDQAVVSIQVLQEYFVAATRKLSVDPLVALEKIELFKRAQVISPSPDLVVSAVRLHLEHQISFWDAMITSAAINAECSILFSEDLQHKRRFGLLTILNPFA